MEAIILAGGKGTRLRPLTLTVPKPMVPIADKPFLYYLLNLLSSEGVTRVIFSVGYLGEQIKEYFGDCWQNMELIYVFESEPLGTGGAIAECLERVNDEEVIVINGDTFCKIDLHEMISTHKQNNAQITIALKEMFNFDRYGTVEVDSKNRITRFNDKRAVKHGMINTGTYCLNKNIFKDETIVKKFSFESDFMEIRIGKLKSYAFITDGYFIDIGIHDDYQRFQQEITDLSF